MGAKLEDDAFGKAMLDSGISKETIMAWTKDPQASPPYLPALPPTWARPPVCVCPR